MYMREKAALCLDNVDSKEDFESARAEDCLDSPKKVSVKIIRKPAAPQTPRRESSADKPADISSYVVEAAEQSIQDTPSKRSLNRLSLLAMTEPQADACVPAALNVIRKKIHIMDLWYPTLSMSKRS